MDKDFYNRSSATQLGWDPSWFGEKYFDDKLVRAKHTSQWFTKRRIGRFALPV